MAERARPGSNACVSSPILSYCMNVHPGETLEELLELLRGPVAQVRAGWRGEEPMGAGLWLPLEIARAIATSDEAAAQVRDLLGASSLFAFTANAFPIGGFHGERVKRRVYRPTWSDPERLEYTKLACRALARLLPDGARGSVSTVPVSYKAFPESAYLAQAGEQLGRLTAELLAIEAETGHEVALALEPEPMALLETTEEAIAYLEKYVFREYGRETLQKEGGLSAADAEAALRRLIGVCVDTCHLACQFEYLPDSLAAFQAAGVRIVKGQLSSALELPDPSTNEEGAARLRGFDEPRYLHQVVAMDGKALPRKELIRGEDIDQLYEKRGRGARARYELSPAFADAAVVRSHFHVPVFWEGDPELLTTRPDLEDALAPLAAATDHLEVETYTFDVIPAEERAAFGEGVVPMLVEELRWASRALQAEGITVR